MVLYSYRRIWQDTYFKNKKQVLCKDFEAKARGCVSTGVQSGRDNAELNRSKIFAWEIIPYYFSQPMGRIV
jgi:hypothetical protein